MKDGGTEWTRGGSRDGGSGRERVGRGNECMREGGTVHERGRSNGVGESREGG